MVRHVNQKLLQRRLILTPLRIPTAPQESSYAMGDSTDTGGASRYVSHDPSHHDAIPSQHADPLCSGLSFSRGSQPSSGYVSTTCRDGEDTRDGPQQNLIAACRITSNHVQRQRVRLERRRSIAQARRAQPRMSADEARRLALAMMEQGLSAASSSSYAQQQQPGMEGMCLAPSTHGPLSAMESARLSHEEAFLATQSQEGHVARPPPLTALLVHGPTSSPVPMACDANHTFPHRNSDATRAACASVSPALSAISPADSVPPQGRTRSSLSQVHDGGDAADFTGHTPSSSCPPHSAASCMPLPSPVLDMNHDVFLL